MVCGVDFYIGSFAMKIFKVFFSTSTVGVAPKGLVRLRLGLFYLFYHIRKFSGSKIDSTINFR